MNDSERFLLIFSLTIFFGMMALGLVVIHGNSKTQQYLESIAVQERAAATKLTKALNCFNGDAYTAFLEKEKAAKPYRHFLQSTSDDGSELDVYLDASPSGNGAFFIVESATNGKNVKGCMIAKGNNMRMVLPEKADAPAIKAPATEAATEAAVEAAQEAATEAVEAVKDGASEAMEEAQEAIEKATEEAVEVPDAP